VSEETIGQRLRRLRLAAHLSQRDLSSPGVSYAYISRIEAGARRPSVKALRQLAPKLGVTEAYLESGVQVTETDNLMQVAMTLLGTDGIIWIQCAESSRGRVDVSWERTVDGKRLARESDAETVTGALVRVIEREGEIVRLAAEELRLERQLREHRERSKELLGT
jgi:transcriptional regulator with XRE-family HTH domain